MLVLSREEIARCLPMKEAVGVAVQDTAVAAAVLARAKEQGLGAPVSLD